MWPLWKLKGDVSLALIWFWVWPPHAKQNSSSRRHVIFAQLCFLSYDIKTRKTSGILISLMKQQLFNCILVCPVRVSQHDFIPWLFLQYKIHINSISSFLRGSFPILLVLRNLWILTTCMGRIKCTGSLTQLRTVITILTSTFSNGLTYWSHAKAIFWNLRKCFPVTGDNWISSSRKHIHWGKNT